MTKDIKEKAIEWFNDIAELCGKLTSGNVSHLAATIKGLLYIAKTSHQFVRTSRTELKMSMLSRTIMIFVSIVTR